MIGRKLTENKFIFQPVQEEYLPKFPLWLVFLSTLFSLNLKCLKAPPQAHMFFWQGSPGQMGGKPHVGVSGGRNTCGVWRHWLSHEDDNGSHNVQQICIRGVSQPASRPKACLPV